MNKAVTRIHDSGFEPASTKADTNLSGWWRVAGSGLNSKCIAQSIVEFAQLLCRQGANIMGQLLLEHPGQKVTAQSTISRQILTHTQNYLAAKPRISL